MMKSSCELPLSMHQLRMGHLNEFFYFVSMHQLQSSMREDGTVVEYALCNPPSSARLPQYIA